MAPRRINSLPIALDSAFNRIVRYQVATNESEANEIVARLPVAVSNGLDSELDVCMEAHRYDLDGKRAYCFQREGDRLHVWIWNEVDTYVEAGDLLSLIVSLEKDLSEEFANEVYARATGRSVHEPRAAPPDDHPGKR